MECGVLASNCKNINQYRQIGILKSAVDHSTLTLFASAASAASLWFVAPYSGVFRFIAAVLFVLTLKLKLLGVELGFGPSSLKKLGPDPTTGVAKFSGLGRVLLSPPLKFQSG